MRPGRTLERALFLLCFIGLYILSDAHKHKPKLETPDLLRIVDAVKKDVDSHLKGLSNIRINVEAVSTQSKQKSVEEKEEFAKTMKDARDFHIVKHLGPPSDAEKVNLSLTLKKTKVYPTEKSKPESAVVTDKTDNISHYPEPQSTESTSGDNYESSTHGYPINAGSIKGLPGVHFPDYEDIPITSFTCSDKEYVPGFYADLECGCQVFHVCWPHRRESFLCPVGTTFNQALLACDYWYSSNCSLAPHYYSVNAQALANEKDENTSSMIDALLETGHKSDKSISQESDHMTSESVLDFISQFMPVKAKVVVYPEVGNKRSKIVATASIGEKRKSTSKFENQKTKSVDQHHSAHSTQTQNMDTATQSSVPCKVTEESKERYNVLAARLTEALENVLNEVKLDKSITRFYPAVENVIKSIRSLLWDSFKPIVKKYPPFSELYELDIASKKSFGQIPMLVKYLLKQKCGCVEMKHSDVTHTRKLPPLTKLNPRFIVKAVEAEPVKHAVSSTKFKQPVTLEFSSTSKFNKNKASISPKTKKSLHKNYMKLLSKHRLADYFQRNKIM